jgi:hypothetical protein
MSIQDSPCKTDAELVAEGRDRMPVILESDQFET